MCAIPRAATDGHPGPVRGETWQTRRPLRTRERLLWWLSLLLVCGLQAATVAMARSVGGLVDPYDRLVVLIDLLAAVATAATGLVLWRWRPNSSAGVLFTAGAALVGVLPFLWWLAAAHAPAAGTAAVVTHVALGLAPAIFAHVMLTFPGGWPHRRAVGRFLLAAYVAVPVSRLIGSTFGDLTYVARCAEACPANPVRLADGPDELLATVDVASAVVLFLVVCTTAVFAVDRYRGAGAADRRRLGPLFIAGAVLGLTQTTAGVWSSLRAAGAPVVQSDAALFATTVVATIAYLTMPVALVVGLLTTRLARANVADVVAVSAHAEPDAIARVLVRVLGDPDAAVVTSDADPETRSTQDGVMRRTELGHGAVLLTRTGTADSDPVLFAAVVDALRLGLENARLAAEVQAQLAEAEASRTRLAEASDRARRQLERDLHDGAQQQLLGLGMTLLTARRAVADDSAAAAHLDDAAAQLRTSLTELRQLSRGLRPALLAERGLDVAIHDLCRRVPVPVTIQVDLTFRPEPLIETTAYYVVAEALQNATRHAPAASALVTVDQPDGGLVVAVSDTGPGGADAALGTGLRGLSDRVRAAGGHLTVSSPAGQGTTVRACFPALSQS